MSKRAESTEPFSVIGGWVLILVAAIVILVIMATVFGFIDLGALSGVHFG